MTITGSHRHLVALAAAVVGGLLLTGCSNQPTTTIRPLPSQASAPTSEAPTPTASPTPSSTPAAEKQQALDEATATVLAYEQAIYDILADPTPTLNDINNYATQPLLADSLESLLDKSLEVASGKVVILDTGPVTLDQVEPIKIDLKASPPVVVLEACLDRTGTNVTYEGKRVEPPRQRFRYRVVKTTYLPAPGWAVSKMMPPAGHDQPPAC